MIIEILNKRSARYRTLKSEGLVIDVDRSTPLGNPFFMHAESERNLVCEQYKHYFIEMFNEQRALHNPDDPTKFPFFQQLYEIFCRASKEDIYLGCWCAPKRCHAETIQKAINYAVNQKYNLHLISAAEIEREIQ